MKKKHTTTVTNKEARKLKGETDWERVRALTEEELDQAVRDDPDTDFFSDEVLKTAMLIIPGEKTKVSIRLNKEVVEWFKKQAGGRGYQTRINALLTAYVASQKRAQG